MGQSGTFTACQLTVTCVAGTSACWSLDLTGQHWGAEGFCPLKGNWEEVSRTLCLLSYPVESSANHGSLHCSLEETHLPGSQVWDPVPFRHIPNAPFPWALLFTEERQIEPAELNWIKRAYVYRSRFYGCLSTTLSRFHLIWIHIATKNHLLSLALPGKVSSLESLLPHRMYQEKRSRSETVMGFSGLG